MGLLNPLLMQKQVSFILVVLFQSFSIVSASAGDRSPFYENCVKSCLNRNCTDGGESFTKRAAALQDEWARMVGWTCLEECRYDCMWRTVSAYEERGYPIPKFHGKWPFKRILGAQEPAAAFSSALNLLAHVYMYIKLLKDKRFTYNGTPLFLFWHVFFAVCANAWVWSTLFHTRDTPFTEFMDYAGAISMVMMLFIAAVVRLLYRRRKVAIVIVAVILIYFVDHVRYLYLGPVDYEYNMTVNIICGMLGTVLWLVLALAAWCGPASSQAARRYVWRLVAFCKLSGGAVLLELFDFPPYRRVWDAHALWHLVTAPLPLLFYRFVIDDLDYLQTIQRNEKKTEYKLA